jgi:plasmid stability protein
MATLYVENVPDEIYEALRGRAHEHRRSIAAEVISLLEAAIPTRRELKARQALLRKLQRMHSGARTSARRFPSTEEMQLEDRGR